MKKVRSFIVGTAILTVATGAVMSSPWATFAQNESAGKGGFAHRQRMHRMSGAGDGTARDELAAIHVRETPLWKEPGVYYRRRAGFRAGAA